MVASFRFDVEEEWLRKRLDMYTITNTHTPKKFNGQCMGGCEERDDSGTVTQESDFAKFRR